LTPEYKCYRNARQRCTDPNAAYYERYGGRGIKFRFKSFQEFYSYLGPKPKRYELDRIDNDGHYEPGNVRWVTHKDNCRNRARKLQSALKLR